MGSQQLLHRVGVVGLGVEEALGQRGKVGVEGVLSRGGQGGDGTAVEAVLQGDDMVVVASLCAVENFSYSDKVFGKVSCV